MENGQRDLQQQGQQQFKCTGNCLACMPAQRAYCASQHAYSNMKVLDAMMGEVIALRQAVRELSEQVEGMQDDQTAVFNPKSQQNQLNPQLKLRAQDEAEEKKTEANATGTVADDKAQEGNGAG